MATTIVGTGLSPFSGYLIFAYGGGFPAHATLALGSLGALIAYAVHRRHRLLRRVALVANLFIFVGAVALGQLAFTRAFNDCIDNADRVRSELAGHFARFDRYPSSLDELASNLPCQRFPFGTLLDYKSSDTGYQLSFGDRFVEHVASETQGFVAHK